MLLVWGCGLHEHAWSCMCTHACCLLHARPPAFICAPGSQCTARTQTCPTLRASACTHPHHPPTLQGLFNFKPSVRPVPLEVHIQGYPGKFYCPRMATMNKPAYAAIQTHSPIKPVRACWRLCHAPTVNSMVLAQWAHEVEPPHPPLRCLLSSTSVLLALVHVHPCASNIHVQEQCVLSWQCPLCRCWCL